MRRTKSKKWVRQADWPESDRTIWLRARSRKPSFLEESPVPQWAPATWEHTASTYCRWLGFLSDTGRLIGTDPCARVTQEAVYEYVKALDTSVAPCTVWNNIKGLAAAMRIFAPERDFGWLMDLANWLILRVHRSPTKRFRVRDSHVLFQLGIDLMEHPRQAARHQWLLEAVDFRDGLLISLLAARPLRLRNLTNIIIGQNLVFEHGLWHLRFQGPETKTGSPIELRVPDDLVAYLERYVRDYRPRFPGAGHHGLLWASWKSGPLTDGAIYMMVTRRTKEAFGVSVNPHLFRDCAATTIAIHDPEHVRTAAPILGHRRFETTERYYNQATSLSAAREHQGHITALRQRGRAKARG